MTFTIRGATFSENDKVPWLAEESASPEYLTRTECEPAESPGSVKEAVDGVVVLGVVVPWVSVGAPAGVVAPST